MSRSHKLPFLEGLRGIAAFAVVLHHLHLAFFPASSSDIHARMAFLPDLVAGPIEEAVQGLWNGTYAVWLFWIMSAFVLSLQFFLRARETPPTRARDYLKDAFLRRYPRLLVPVLASVAFAYALHSRGLMHNLALAHSLGPPYDKWLGLWYRFPPDAMDAFKSAVWQTFFAYDDAHTYNNVLWSMQPEFYGSLFLFAFLGLLGSRGSRFFFYPLIVLVNFWFGLHWLNAFVAGIALCDYSVNQNSSPAQHAPRRPILRLVRHNGFAAAVCWVLIFVCIGPLDDGSILYFLVGVAAIGLTLLSIPTQLVLSRSVPVFLGRISFGLYLVHVPIICSFSCWMYVVTFRSLGAVAAAFLVSAVTCVLSVAVGYVFYLTADVTGLRFSRWLSRAILSAPGPGAQRPGAVA